MAFVLAGVLGFVIFAFGDVSDAWRPLAEIATAVVLFGTGAFLRRRGAPFVGDALVLLGGLVTPILIVAAFADGSPVPPDLSGRTLAAVLSVLMIAAGGAFALAVRRRPDSPLRFLVAPMVWWAAATAGLALTSTGIAGRDVAEPFPWQWAVVAATVTATLIATRLWPEAPLSRPTRVAGWIGVPLAELLVLGAAAGSGWPAGPALVAGAATGVSIALLLPGRGVLVTNLQGGLVLLTALACGPALGIGWCAAVVVIALVGLVEHSVHERLDVPTATVWLSLAALAAAISLVEPVAGLSVAAAGMTWSSFRLARPVPALGRWPATVGAFGFPVLAVAAAGTLWNLDVSVVGLALVLTVVAAGQRTRRGLRHLGVTVWVLTQAGLVIVLVLAELGRAVGRDGAHVTALVVVAVAVALVPRWPSARVWLVAGVAGLAGLVAASSLDWSTGTAAMVVSGLALALVAIGQPRAAAVNGHVAVMAHVAGVGALVAAFGALDELGGTDGLSVVAATIVAGAIGWTLSTAVGESRGSAERDLWVRLLAGEAGDTVTRWSPAAPDRPQYGSVVPAVAALMWWLAVPPTVLVATDRLDGNDAWLPVSALIVALVGVGGARALVTTRPLLAHTLAAGIWVGVIAVPGAASWWPAVTASVLVVAMAAISGPALGNLFTVTLGWVASGVAAVTLAGALGVAQDALYRVAFAWGAAILIGGLLVDEAHSGPRTAGTVVRRAELWPPFVLGAATVPLALLPIVGEPATVAGWMLVAAAGLAFVTAGLLRLAVVSIAGWIALGVAAVLLAPWDPFALPWSLAALAVAFVAAAEVVHDAVAIEDRTRYERRWDLPPFAVGQTVAVIALLDSAVVGWVPATWLAISALWALVAIRLRSPWWLVPAVPAALVGAAVAGPAWLTLGLGVTVIGSAIAATRSPGDARTAFQILTAVTTAGWWASTAWWQGWDAETLAIATASAAGVAFVALAVGVRWLHLDQDWLAALVTVPVMAEIAAAALLVDPSVPRWPARLVVAAGIGSCAAATGLLARPTGQGWLRWVTAAVAAGAAVLAADGAAVAMTPFVLLALAGSGAAVLAGSLLLEVGDAAGHRRPWSGPVLLAGGLLLVAGLLGAATQLPDRPLMVLGFGTVGVELLGVGFITRRIGWAVGALWAFLAAWITFASEALTGDAQWITMPLGLTVLAMVELLRWSRRRAGLAGGVPELVLADLAGMAFLVGPAIVDTVTRSPVWGLVTAALGAGLVMLGTATRVRCRLVVGAVTVGLALVLMIVPPLVELVPPLTGWVPWALLAAIGLVALSIAAFLEKGRRLVRRGVQAFAELTRDWD